MENIMSLIKIYIKPDGKVETHVHQVKGKACLALTKPLETAIGDVEHRHLTSEYYSTVSKTQPLIQKKGVNQ